MDGSRRHGLAIGEADSWNPVIEKCPIHGDELINGECLLCLADREWAELGFVPLDEAIDGN